MKTHETDIPPQQASTQEENRLPRPHENCRGTQSDQPPPQSRPKKARRLTFPKIARLRSRREFQRVVKEGERLVGQFLCIDRRLAAKLRLGVGAPRRFGSAPKRNRFKRLVREAFRQCPLPLPPFELNIFPRQSAKKASFADIAEEFNRLLFSK